jgi:hypothetical protein
MFIAFLTVVMVRVCAAAREDLAVFGRGHLVLACDFCARRGGFLPLPLGF